MMVRVCLLLMMLSICTIAEAKWSHKEEADPKTNDVNYFLYSLSSEGRNHLGKKIGLIMRCKNDRLILYVNWGVNLGGQNTVAVRFDTNQSEAQIWASSADKTALFQPQPKVMFQQMLTSKTLELETKPRSGSTIKAVFSLTGLSLASHKMRRNCDTKIQ